MVVPAYLAMRIIAVAALLARGSQAGKYEVELAEVEVGGYLCDGPEGGSQNATIFYPVTDEKLPLVSFAHGYGGEGEKGVRDYMNHNTQLAAEGYVLIHLMSSSKPRECEDEWKDQIRNFEWMKTSSFSSRVDWSKPTAVVGHSMGGHAAYHSASQQEVIATHNIGAAIAENPQIELGKLLPRAGSFTNSLVPIFFQTGSSDRLILPAGVREAYDRTTGVPKIFAEIEGARHLEPTTGQNRFNEYSVAFLDCHLLDDSSQCAKVYGSASGSLCNGQLTMTACLHENEPISSLVV